MCVETGTHTLLLQGFFSAFARQLPWRLPLLPMPGDGTSNENAPLTTHTVHSCSGAFFEDETSSGHCRPSATRGEVSIHHNIRSRKHLNSSHLD